MTELTTDSASGASMWPDAVLLERAPEGSVAPARRVASQSGLALQWDTDGPALPQMTSQRAVQLAGKRLFDVLFALASILALSPLLMATAVAIRLTSRGPVLFKQKRTGQHGRPIEVYKFRTMRVEEQDHSGVEQTKPGDERITTLGLMLRRRNLDELPQLINVLRGEMSIIGPRPHPVVMFAGGKQYEDLIPYYNKRHAMKPGISGWAQCNGLRGPTDDGALARARIDHDLAYIQNFSLWLDLRIIFLTLKRELLSGSGV